MNDFHSTRMGQRYYERDVPAAVEQLTRLNDNLEAALLFGQEVWRWWLDAHTEVQVEQCDDDLPAVDE